MKKPDGRAGLKWAGIARAKRVMQFAWMKLIIGIALGLLLAPSLARAESLLCVGELSSGLRWDGSRWVTATFNVDNDRYVVQPTASGSSEYSVTRFGETEPVHTCERRTYGTMLAERLICGGLGMGMLIDFKQLRFQENYGMGFIDGEDREGNTPNLTIGRCTRLNQ